MNTVTQEQDAPQNVFDRYLLPDEVVLWQGQPHMRTSWALADTGLFLFGMALLGIAVYCAHLAFRLLEQYSLASFVPAVLGVATLLTGYRIVSFHLLSSRTFNRVMHYAVTNVRVLILSTGADAYLRAYSISAIGGIERKVERACLNCLRFDVDGEQQQLSPAVREKGLSPTFYCLPDADAVCDLVDRLKTTQANAKRPMLESTGRHQS